jgi:hypothetical protein
MNRILPKFVLIAGCLLFISCGGQEESQEAPESTSVPKTSPEQTSKPFAREQQLIKDAKAVQSILNQDAEERKKALKDVN